MAWGAGATFWEAGCRHLGLARSPLWIWAQPRVRHSPQAPRALLAADHGGGRLEGEGETGDPACGGFSCQPGESRAGEGCGQGSLPAGAGSQMPPAPGGEGSRSSAWPPPRLVLVWSKDTFLWNPDQMAWTGGLSADAPPHPARAGLTQAPAKGAGPRAGGSSLPAPLSSQGLLGHPERGRRASSTAPCVRPRFPICKMGTRDSAVARVSTGFSYPQGPGVPCASSSPLLQGLNPWGWAQLSASSPGLLTPQRDAATASGTCRAAQSHPSAPRPGHLSLQEDKISGLTGGHETTANNECPAPGPWR